MNNGVANTKKTAKSANIWIVAEFLVGVFMSLIAYFFLTDTYTTATVLMIGTLIAMSTYILKSHITCENLEQTGEYKKYLNVVKLWAEIDRHENEDIREQGARLIRETSSRLFALGSGQWSVKEELELDGLIYECVLKSQDSIQATHINVKKWDEEASKDLFRGNLKAIERGVKIHRIFILLNEELTDSRVREIIEEHERNGINVECVRYKDLPADIAKDFMIFDERKLVTEDLTPDRSKFVNGVVSIDPGMISEWKANFRNISIKAADSAALFFDDLSRST